MILSIQQGADNPILRKKSQDVTEIKNPEIHGLILDMKETLAKADGLGLAAPQVGKNLRIFVANKKNIDAQIQQNASLLKKIFRGKMPEVFINPKIVKFSKEKEIMEEGCLSLPGIWGLVERHEAAEIEALNEKGKKFKVKSSGLLAQVFQHETDHLDGILFIDKAVNPVRDS